MGTIAANPNRNDGAPHPFFLWQPNRQTNLASNENRVGGHTCNCARSREEEGEDEEEDAEHGWLHLRDPATWAGGEHQSHQGLLARPQECLARIRKSQEEDCPEHVVQSCTLLHVASHQGVWLACQLCHQPIGNVRMTLADHHQTICPTGPMGRFSQTRSAPQTDSQDQRQIGDLSPSTTRRGIARSCRHGPERTPPLPLA